MSHRVPGAAGGDCGRLGPAALGVVMALTIVACMSAPLNGSLVTAPSAAPVASRVAATTEPQSTVAVTPPVASPTPAPTATPPRPTPTPTPATAETRPPPWTLVDASGKRVEGQVGTFQWDGVVSSSPLLPGRKATVRAGQLLGLATNGPTLTSWKATLYKDPTDPRGIPFGEGLGLPALRAPTEIGQWTLAVQVRYPAGDVLHFWRLTVIE